MIKKLLTVALVIAAALTTPQAASAQAAPDERAAAREFAYAAYRLRSRIKAEEPLAHRRFASLNSRACRTTLGPDQDRDLDEMPVRVQRGLAVILVEMEFGTTYGSVAHLFPGFVAELDRVATADPALVAGRESWRSTAGFLAQLAPLPSDTCAQVRRWRLAGYPFDRVPALQPRPIHDILMKAVSAQPSNPKPDRSKDRAAARMIALGVPEGQAKRFAGDTLLRGMPSTIVVEGGDEDV